MHPIQMRMAMAGLKLTARDLAKRIGVTKNTISNISLDLHSKGGKRGPTLRLIRSWLEDYVVFVEAKPGEHGPGVILKEGAVVDTIERNGFPVAEDGGEQITASWRQEAWEDQCDIGIEVSMRFGA